MLSVASTKTCYRCKEEKSLEEFNSNRTKRDGKSTYCRLCHREVSRRWQKLNPEQVREQRRRQREQIRESQKRYRERNRGVINKKEMNRKNNQKRTSAALATRSGRWSEEETLRFIELRETKTIYQCAIELSRTTVSVKDRARLLHKQGRI